MRKIHKTSKLLALTLSASIAAFGCTTNWNRSDGEPAMGATNGSSPSATPGSSGGTTTPQPMTSSSMISQPMTSSSQVTRRSPEAALAIMQQTRTSLGPQAVVLGESFPPITGEARIGGYQASSFGTVRQLTINSSISNPLGPQPAIVSGAGEGSDVAALFGDVVVGTTVTPTASGVTAPATIGTVPSTIATAPASTTTGTAVTPTASTIPVTSGVFSASTGTFSPTSSSGSVPSPTVATSPVVLGNSGMLSSSSIGTTSAVIAPATSAGTVRSSMAAPRRLNRAVTTNATSAITVTQSATGKIIISNVK